MISKKRHYILLVSRDEDGTLHKVPVPLGYVYAFVAAAVIGLFTMTGLAGSYSRMLIKTAHFNQLRHDHQTLQNDYAHLEVQAHEKDVQAASLGSLANEVSALYGMTAGKISSMRGPRAVSATLPAGTALANPAGTATASFTNDTYYKSVDAFYALRASAMSGDTTRLMTVASPTLGHMMNPLLPGHELPLGNDSGPADGLVSANTPTIWPVTGPITSSFGEREDPVLGNGTGEFHPGLDISGALGTPIHVTADGVVVSADVVNGYGRMVKVDHGHGLMTLYGHMSGFAVSAGEPVTRGQVVGYMGHSGRATGNHCHYEVRINNTAVNPHKYLRTTLNDFMASAKPDM